MGQDRRPLRVSQSTVDLVAEWSQTAPPLWRERMRDLIASFKDGTWSGLRWGEPVMIAGSPEVYRLNLETNTNLIVQFQVSVDEGYGCNEFADIIYAPPPPDPAEYLFG